MAILAILAIMAILTILAIQPAATQILLAAAKPSRTVRLATSMVVVLS